MSIFYKTYDAYKKHILFLFKSYRKRILASREWKNARVMEEEENEA